MLDRALRAAAPAALLLWAVWALHGFLEAGLPLRFDAHSHLARSGFVAEALAEGQLPLWTFRWYGGMRLLEFYAPAWYVSTGAIGWAIGDVVAATKGMLFLAQLGAALALYAAARHLDAAPLAALLAAGVFLESAQRGWVLGGIGNYPTALVLLFASVYLAVASGTHRRGLGAVSARALALAAMLAAHLQAFFLVPALLAFDAVRGAGSGARRSLALPATGAALAAALSAFVWLPPILGASRVGLALHLARSPVGFDPGPLAVALGLVPFSWETVYVRTDGFLPLALALLGAVLAWARGSRAGLAAAAGFAASAVSVVLAGERAVLGLGLFTALLVGVLPGELSGLRPMHRAFQPVLVIAVIALLVLTRSPHAREVRFADPDALAIYADLPAAPPTRRTFDRTPRSLCLDGFYGASSAAPLLSGRAVPLGAFPQGAPLASYVHLALLSGLSRAGAPSQTSLDALYLTHVGLLVEEGEARRLPDASPAIYAPHLETLPSDVAGAAGDGLRLVSVLRALWRASPSSEGPADAALRPLARSSESLDLDAIAPALSRLALDRSRARASRFFVDGAAPPSAAGSASTEGRLTVLRHRETATRVELEIDAPGPGWVRLAYTWDPLLEVRVDRDPVRALQGSLGGVLVPIDGGRRTIVVEARPSRVYVVLFVTCALAAGGLLAAGPWIRRRDRGHP